MSLELNLRFSGVDRVEVRIDGEESGLLPFVNPLTPKDRDDLRWYLETYGAYSNRRSPRQPPRRRLEFCLRDLSDPRTVCCNLNNAKTREESQLHRMEYINAGKRTRRHPCE
ncbi:MAG: hypothetical protein ACI8P0_002708 [Planctomycetaceae bacterium]|jgi:hypothetical protein